LNDITLKVLVGGVGGNPFLGCKPKYLRFTGTITWSDALSTAYGITGYTSWSQVSNTITYVWP